MTHDEYVTILETLYADWFKKKITEQEFDRKREEYRQKYFSSK